MSIRFDVTGDYIARATDLPNYNGTYTVMGWFYQAVDTNAVAIMILISNTAATQLDALTFPADGTTLQLQSNVSTVTGSALGLGAWHHLAMVRESATSWKLYLDGVLDITNTGNVGTARTLNIMYCGGLAASHLFSGRIAGFKQFTNAMTIDEVNREMLTLRPADLSSNRVAWYPMWPGATEHLADYSGAGLNWTAAGTLTDEDPPPVSYGSPIRFYPITASAGAQTISPSGIASGAAIGSHTLTSAATISPSAIESTVAIGSHTLSGAATISPSGVDSTAAIGSHTLSGAATISPNGVASTAAIGSHTLSGSATISPNGVAGTSNVGSHAISSTATISPSGVASTVVIGSHTLTPGGVTISPTGVASTVLVGNPIISESVADPDLCPPFGMIVVNPTYAISVINQAVAITVVNPTVGITVVNPLVGIIVVNPSVGLEVVCG